MTHVYPIDDPNHPAQGGQSGGGADPVALYCDVWCYTTIRGYQQIFVPYVLISQDTAGLQSGTIWRPRQATGTLDRTPWVPGQTDPANLDGDHVLVGYMDNDLSSPVIIRSIPHPAADYGFAQTQPELASRLRLLKTDGSPYLRKQNGTVSGITQYGDYLVNTLYANDGTLTQQTPTQNAGKTPPPATTGDYGNLLMLLHSHATRLTRLINMQNPAKPKDVAQEILDATSYTIKFLTGGEGNALNVQGSDDKAYVRIGDGGVHAAAAEPLEALLNDLIAKFNNHTHNSSVGPTAPAAASGFVAKPWDKNIQGTHLSFPANKANEGG
ncbi:MAG: hypothetical protein EOO40_00845 [Deltaproteobacteria bacterium]|nr:MAG: hypothetical protein EOO40_00845 [Deltaproteobacteria bacterium]